MDQQALVSLELKSVYVAENLQSMSVHGDSLAHAAESRPLSACW